MNKLTRLRKLLNLLESGEKYLTAPELAKRLDVSVRTIYRYLQELDEFGVPIDNEFGYRTSKGCSFFPFKPSSGDLRMIQDLIDTSPLAKLPDLKDHYQRLRAQLTLLLSGGDEEEDIICDSEPFVGDRLAFSLEELENACFERRICRILYHALDEEEPSYRTIHPYGIAIRLGQWYLIALDGEKNEFRIYKFLRIKTLFVTNQSFQRDADFCFDRFFEDSWNVFQGPMQTVRLRVRGMAARLASERSFPKRMEVDWQSADEAIITATMRGDQEIVNWVLSMGAEAEILAPPELREKVRQILSASLRRYED
ncbi:MAG: WYL domain-containing protein [Candidatus Omnitrophota bacterium]